MNRTSHPLAPKKSKPFNKAGEDAWNRVCSLSPDQLEKTLSINDTDWIKMLLSLVQIRTINTQRFKFTKDIRNMWQVTFIEQYDSAQPIMMNYIRIKEYPKGIFSLVLSEQCLATFSDLKSLFLSITGNGFMTERPQNSPDYPYELHYKTQSNFTIDMWIIQMLEFRIWKYNSKNQYYHNDDIAQYEQQEQILLDFWNTYLPPELHTRIVQDYIKRCTDTMNVASFIISQLQTSKYKLQTLYVVPIQMYISQPVMALCRQLLGYVERLRKTIYGISVKDSGLPIMHISNPVFLYNHLLDGAMMPLQSDQGIPSDEMTPGNRSLKAKENMKLMSALGEDVILFTEWCQNHSTWRRRGYLAVVEELTRIIHKEFKTAQIELYGSSRTGLMIPSSDVDIVIVHNTNLLDKVVTLLNDVPWIREVKDIRGSVQVVKVIIDHTVITNTTLIPTLEHEALVCDITQITTTHTGIITAVAIRNKLNKFWELTPLILFMKQLLYENQLNSAYEGGLNSVAAVILVMCYFYERYGKNEQASEGLQTCPYPDKLIMIGYTLLRLIYFIGFQYNYVTTGIDADRGFFNRDDMTIPVNQHRMFESDHIVVVDPVNPSNNLGKSCFNVYQIKDLFRKTYIHLLENIDNEVEHPVLQLLKITDQCLAFHNHYI